MSIEPSSVSNTAVREVERTSSNLNSWTSMQGSSTSGKDRPSSSIWEKAIAGAQKLLGVENSESTAIAEDAEGEDSTETNVRNEAGAALDLVPGFGSRGFSRFRAGSLPSFFGSANGNVNTNEFTAPESSNNFETEREVSFSKSERSEKREPSEVPQARAQEAPLKEKPMVEEEAVEDEDGRSEQRAAKKIEAAPVAAAARPVASAAVPSQAVATNPQVAAQASQAEVVAAPQTVVSQSKQIQATTPEARPNTLAASPSTPVASLQVQVTSKPVLNTAAANAAQPTATPTSQTPATVGEASVAKNAEAAIKANLGQANEAQAQSTSKAVSPAPTTEVAKTDLTGKTEPTVAETAKKPEGDTLSFDPAKAKEAVSEGLLRSAKRTAANTASQTSPAGQTATVSESRDLSTRPQLATETQATRLPDSANTESANATNVESPRRDSQFPAGQQRSGSAKGAVEANVLGRATSAAEANPSAQAGASHQASNLGSARDLAGAAASRTQVANTSNKSGNAGNTSNSQTTAASSVAGSQTSAGNPAMQGAKSGSQGQDGESMAKQDLGSTLKNSTTAKGTEKTGDSAQSFEAKVEAAESRRSEAAAKTKQTSYVSKTAAEVKEIMTSLTKSIDRLVTDKLGTMNLKLNFEGGGSMNLRISMDAGQVNTVMLTDVSGLENAIKANWSELANDWNQKGVKLNVPQFQNSEAGRDAAGENEFSFRQDRQADGRSGEGRSRSSGATGTRQSASGTMEEGAETGNGRTPREEVVSDTELKTYA